MPLCTMRSGKNRKIFGSDGQGSPVYPVSDFYVTIEFVWETSYVMLTTPAMALARTISQTVATRNNDEVVASGTTTVRARQSDGRGRRAHSRPLVSRSAFAPVGSSDARLV